MKLRVKISVGYTGPACCEICQQQSDGLGFQLEAALPFGRLLHTSRHSKGLFYCWRCFQQALQTSDFSIDIVRIGPVRAPLREVLDTPPISA